MKTPTAVAFQKRILSSLALVFLLALSALNPARATDIAAQEFNFDIPAQSLTSALLAFSAQTGLQVVTSGATLPTSDTSAITGRQTIATALGQLLIGTGLKYQTIGDTTITLVPAQRTSATGNIHLAQATTNTESPNSTSEGSSEPSEDKSVKIQEIVVTAQKRSESIQDAAVSLSVLTDESIDRRGLVSSEDYLRGIPGVNQTTDRN